MSADRINDGGPAFPESGLSGLPNGEFIHGRAGMSLRDYFAAKAVSSLIRTVQKGGKTGPDAHGDDFEWVATRAYLLADAMLKVKARGS